MIPVSLDWYASQRPSGENMDAWEDDDGDSAKGVAFRGFICRLGQPEGEHLHDSRRLDHDVGRLQIAVDDVFLMRGFERVPDLPGVAADRRKNIVLPNARPSTPTTDLGKLRKRWAP